ncbi:AsmA-like C-terminal region-containing protein [Acetobacter sp.]|uniref:AsmA family protein n=1 Tax=Acetobacter sp. TaxID=440 RepID=UPI0039EA2E26
MRRFTLIAFGAAGLAVAASAAGLFTLSHMDLAAFATKKLTQTTGRPVHIGSLHVSPGRWLTVDVDDLSIANIPTGSRPQMITLGHLHTQVRLMSLFHGPAETRDLILTNFSGLFERTPDRTPNWRFGSKPAEKSQEKPRKPAPADTSWFPGLRQATIKGSEIIYRSANGHSYRVGLDNVAITSASDTAPVEMTVDGSYNGTPIALTAHMGPLTILREANKPLPTKLHASSGDLTVDLDGAMTDLMDFDGVDGKLSLNTPTSAPLMAFAGEPASTFVMALGLTGQFHHAGDVWHIAQGKGRLGNNPIDSADLTFTEGKPGAPDSLTGEISFAKLDLNSLLPTTKSSPKPESHTDIPLIVPAKPDPLFDLRLSAGSVRYNALEFSNAALTIRQQPNRIDVPSFHLGWLGASLQASGNLTAHPQGSSLTAAIDVTGADIDRFRKQAGLAPVPVNGALSFRVRASATGAHTLNEASRKADLEAVVGMNSGTINRQVIDIASTNVGLLFHKNTGTTPITCLLGALTLHQGMGTVVPLRIVTPAGSIIGEAMFNLDRRWFELAFQSEAPGMLALDIPIRVSGPFSNPSIGLAGWSARGRALLKGARATNSLPPTISSFSVGSACLKTPH